MNRQDCSTTAAIIYSFQAQTVAHRLALRIRISTQCIYHCRQVHPQGKGIRLSACPSQSTGATSMGQRARREEPARLGPRRRFCSGRQAERTAANATVLTRCLKSCGGPCRLFSEMTEGAIQRNAFWAVKASQPLARSGYTASLRPCARRVPTCSRRLLAVKFVAAVEGDFRPPAENARRNARPAKVEIEGDVV